MIKPLTRSQEKLFTYYMEYFWENQRFPTVRNLCKKFEYKSTNGARQHLKLIAAKGYLVKVDGGFNADRDILEAFVFGKLLGKALFSEDKNGMDACIPEQ